MPFEAHGARLIQGPPEKKDEKREEKRQGDSRAVKPKKEKQNG